MGAGTSGCWLRCATCLRISFSGEKTSGALVIAGGDGSAATKMQNLRCCLLCPTEAVFRTRLKWRVVPTADPLMKRRLELDAAAEMSTLPPIRLRNEEERFIVADKALAHMTSCWLRKDEPSAQNDVRRAEWYMGALLVPWRKQTD